MTFGFGLEDSTAMFKHVHFFPFGTLPFHFNFSKADLLPFMMLVFLLILIVKFM